MKNSFKETCIRLRKRDFTLNEIMRATGRSKTSVHFHIQKIPLSKRKQETVRINNAERIKQYSLAKKGKSLRKFNKIDKWDKTSVSLVTHLLFDGEINKRKCVYNNRSKILIDRVKNALKQFYDYGPHVDSNKLTGVIRISYYNVALSIHLKEKSEELLKEVVNFSEDLKRIFLISFFDDEGNVYYCKKRKEKRIRGYQHDYKMLLLIQKLLEDFNIKSKVSEKFNEITITRKENLEKFQKEINFSPGVRVNGKRKNSVWKKDLEKREILKMAIDSYQ